MTTAVTMTDDELRVLLRENLALIAPEADLDELSATADVRDTLDIDSFDFLNFLIAVNEQTGVEIPEADYGQLASLDDIVLYLRARMA